LSSPVTPSSLDEYIAKKRGDTATADADQLTPYTRVYAPEKVKKASQRQMRSSDVVKKFLESRSPTQTNSLGQNRLHQILLNMFDIASDRRSPFAVAAANLLLDRAYGKVKPSEEELGAIERGGTKIVLVSPQDVGMAEPPALPSGPQPDFLDVEIVDEGE
jgi:hypothetical protein